MKKICEIYDISQEYEMKEKSVLICVSDLDKDKLFEILPELKNNFNEIFNDCEWQEYLEINKTRKIQEIEETTYENFEDAKYKLQISGTDTPMNRLEETKKRSNSYADSEQIRYGAGIYLTREDEIEHQISWEDEDNAET